MPGLRKTPAESAVSAGNAATRRLAAGRHVEINLNSGRDGIF